MHHRFDLAQKLWVGLDKGGQPAPINATGDDGLRHQHAQGFNRRSTGRIEFVNDRVTIENGNAARREHARCLALAHGDGARQAGNDHRR